MKTMGSALAVALLLLGTSTADAKTYSGVKMDDTMQVGETTLKLNGMGLRKKFIVKVYVGGLYIVTPSKSAEEILAADAPRAVVMHFLRDVDKGKLVEAWREGFQKNSPDKAPGQKANIDKFMKIVTDVKEGQRITFVYEPGKGSTLTWPDGKTETMEGKDFADVFLANYIGRDPPSGDFKDGLLGK